jgi:hypothetical protein
LDYRHSYLPNLSFSIMYFLSALRSTYCFWANHTTATLYDSLIRN